MNKLGLRGSYALAALVAFVHCSTDGSSGGTGGGPEAGDASTSPTPTPTPTPSDDAGAIADGTTPVPSNDAASEAAPLPPNAPTANAQVLGTNEDTAVNGTLTASDPAGLPLTMSIVTAPTKGTLPTFDAKTGAFQYLPNKNANGQDSFTFKANNGSVSSAPATVTINVAPVADAPYALSQFLHVPKNGSVSVRLAGTNVDGAAMTYSAQSVAHGLLTGSAPNLTYAPTTDYVGADSFTFQATSAGGTSSPGTVSFAVGKPEVHFLSVYQGSGGQVSVNVDTGNEVILYVSAFAATKWNFTVAAGTTLKKVVWNNVIHDAYTYYGGAQTFGGVPAGTTVVSGSHDVAYEPGKIATAMTSIKAIEGTPVTAVHAAYQTSSFAVRSRPGGGVGAEMEVHYIEDYNGGGTVNVERAKPVVLVLSSYTGGGWTINPINGTDVRKVVMCSYSLSSASKVSGTLPESYAMHCGGYSYALADGATAGFVAGTSDLPRFDHGTSRTITP